MHWHRSTPAWIESTLAAGAARLCALQADRSRDNAHNGWKDADPDDGGWDWLFPFAASEHTARASPETLYGATALGLWATREALGPNSRWTTAELDAGLGTAACSDVDSPPDIIYLVALAEQTRDRRWSTLARARYDAKLKSSAAREPTARACGKRAISRKTMD